MIAAQLCNVRMMNVVSGSLQNDGSRRRLQGEVIRVNQVATERAGGFRMIWLGVMATTFQKRFEIGAHDGDCFCR